MQPAAINQKPLILLSANSAWNVANFRLGLIEGLQQAGYEVAVAAPPDDHVDRLAAMGIAFIPLKMSRSGMNPVADLKLAARYVRLMRFLRPAAYLGFTIKPNVYGSVAAHLCSIPVINNVSGLGTMFLGRRWKSWLAHGLYRLAMARSKAVFFQNPDDRALFVDSATVPERRARLLPGSGIDLDRFTPTPAPVGAPQFLFIGRLLADKGVREFVEAARLVLAKVPDARFQVAGGRDEGNRSSVSHAEFDQWRREGVVQLLGEVDDVRPFIASASAVVLPSYREGLPRVLLEASAMARPSIATDVPGCRTIVDSGRTGLLCSARDAEALAEAMIAFARLTADERAAMGRAARAKVERDFSERLVVDAYLSAVREIRSLSGVGRR